MTLLLFRISGSTTARMNARRNEKVPCDPLERVDTLYYLQSPDRTSGAHPSAFMLYCIAP